VRRPAFPRRRSVALAAPAAAAALLTEPAAMRRAAHVPAARFAAAAGPGTVALDAVDPMAFLPSRAWLEHRASRSVLQSGEDLARTGREQAFVAALAAAPNGPLVDRFRTGALVVRDGDVAVCDLWPVADWFSGTLPVGRIDLLTVPVAPHRPIDERGPPFVSGRLWAMAWLVADPAAGRAVGGAGCAGGGVEA
jgi:hypothetical protein